MSDNITIADVEYVAALAKIGITKEEAARLQSELATIIEHVQRLHELDTTGVEPTYQVTGLRNVTRKDALIDYGVSTEALLKNAPEQQDQQLKVPKVL